MVICTVNHVYIHYNFILSQYVICNQCFPAVQIYSPWFTIVCLGIIFHVMRALLSWSHYYCNILGIWDGIVLCISILWEVEYTYLSPF